MNNTTDESAIGARRPTPEDLAFAHWSTETTRRLSRTVLRCGPDFSALDLVRTRKTGHEPKPAAEYETDIHQDMLSVVLAHAFYQALLVEIPELAPRLSELSYAEALHVVYHHARRAEDDA